MQSPVTRVGLLLLLIGTIVLIAESFMDTRLPFEGLVALAEGESFEGYPTQYVSLPDRLPDDTVFPEVSFEATSVAPVLDEGSVPVEMAVGVIAHDGDEERTVELTGAKPSFEQNGAVIEARGIEVAPVFTLRVEDGGAPVQVCVKLEIWGDDYPEDHFELPHPSATVVVKFYPDFEMGLHGPTSRSPAMLNPVLAVQVQPKDEEAEAVTGYLAVGDELEIGKVYLGVSEIRYWSLFQISQQRPANLLLLGGLLSLLGLIIAVVGEIRSRQQAAT